MTPDVAALERLLRETLAGDGGTLDNATLAWRVPGGALAVSACYAAMRHVLGEALPASTVLGEAEGVSLAVCRHGKGAA